MVDNIWIFGVVTYCHCTYTVITTNRHLSKVVFQTFLSYNCEHFVVISKFYFQTGTFFVNYFDLFVCFLFIWTFFDIEDEAPN